MTPVHSSSPMELDEDHDGPSALRAAADTPDSPSPRTIDLSRKRAASINTADASYAKFEHLKLDTPTNMNVVIPRDHVCLCTPAPKIPRPRNAFILYRQHHQAQVVAQNPNLSNPDISKIIGEQWNEEPEDIKANWKGLADEEKQRHQRQYPDYRYQPRRGSRAQANRPGTSPADDGARCPKCNGRSIVNPRAPSVPLSAPIAALPEMRPYAPPARGDETDMALRRSYGSLPPTRSRYLSHQHNQHEVEEYDPESPEMKRRRFNAGGAYHSVTSPHMNPGQPSRTMSAGAPPSSMRHYFNATPGLPEPGSLPRSQSGPMAPPPRPPMSGPWAEHSPHPSRHHGFDESLRLPPLQTSVSMSSTAAGEGDGRQTGTPVTGLGISATRDPQPRSVEATIMSVSFVRKMTVLGRICQPVSKVRGSEVDTRGPVIAVEGPKSRILQQVGQAVEKALMESKQFNLKTWANHSIQELDDGDIFDHEREGEPSESHGRYVSHLRTMMLWHEKSQEIEQHIAHIDGPKPDEAGEIPRRGSAESSSSLDSHGKPTSSNVPVALLKEGYSLTVSDMLACNVPITDAYGPIDHWQWLATLWRGVVGPDLVVYVKPSMDEEIAKHGTVHVQKRPGLVLVRIPVGSNLDEATERRVGFEVVEWVRAESYREGLGKT
ncbi:slightly ste11-like protein [Neonectria punicea]|uniref:Slightly ste11-like protein n=1 Tax=Neonectria punicea TaxID=979145 RepID=A0ABR1GHV9_9HYPO